MRQLRLRTRLFAFNWVPLPQSHLSDSSPKGRDSSARIDTQSAVELMPERMHLLAAVQAPYEIPRLNRCGFLRLAPLPPTKCSFRSVLISPAAQSRVRPHKGVEFAWFL